MQRDKFRKILLFQEIYHRLISEKGGKGRKLFGRHRRKKNCLTFFNSCTYHNIFHDQTSPSPVLSLTQARLARVIFFNFIGINSNERTSLPPNPRSQTNSNRILCHFFSRKSLQFFFLFLFPMTTCTQTHTMHVCMYLDDHDQHERVQNETHVEYLQDFHTSYT